MFRKVNHNSCLFKSNRKGRRRKYYKNLLEGTNRACSVIIDIISRFRNDYFHFKPVLNNWYKLSILPSRHSVCIINSANDTRIWLFDHDLKRFAPFRASRGTRWNIHYLDHMKSHTLAALSVHNVCSLIHAWKLTQELLIRKLPVFLNKNIFLTTFMFHK